MIKVIAKHYRSSIKDRLAARSNEAFYWRFPFESLWLRGKCLTSGIRHPIDLTIKRYWLLEVKLFFTFRYGNVGGNLKFLSEIVLVRTGSLTCVPFKTRRGTRIKVWKLWLEFVLGAAKKRDVRTIINPSDHLVGPPNKNPTSVLQQQNGQFLAKQPVTGGTATQINSNNCCKTTTSATLCSIRKWFWIYSFGLSIYRLRYIMWEVL